MQTVTQLGEYQLLEKIGEGGMGAVYKALHTKLKRTVAVKILAKDRGWDDHAVARFEREMEVVGALDHPHIVRAHDAREIDGIRFLVMEYVDGLDVNALHRACHPLRIADACEIIRQTALGLQRAHEHDLVHRDVKPSNLMVTPQGVVKLLDLGLARFEHELPADEEVTGTGQAMGTVDYMAPEQVADARSVDIRADIYSLGCTFYKLLCGQTPFGGPEHKTVAGRLMAHLREPVPPIRGLRADVPDGLARVLDRMLAKEPGERFQSPANVVDAVGPFAVGSDLVALVAGARGQPVPPPLPTQAVMRTQELGSSSGFTRFLRQIVGQSATSVLRPSAGKPSSRMKLASIAGFLTVGLACFVGVLIWGLVFQDKDAAQLSSPPQREGAEVAALKTYLVLHWPVEERSGASIELDGQLQDMERLDLLALGGEINLPISAGEHKAVMKRLGYEPFEQSFTVTAGKDVNLRPTWKQVAAVARPPAAASAVGQASMPAPTSPDKPPVSPTEKPSPATAAAKEPAKKPPAVAASEPKESPEALAARKRLDALDARYAEVMKPAEKLARVWDFRGAAVELGKIRFDEPDLTARLAQRRDELKRMHGLKQKLIGAISAASPPLKKSVLGIRGLGGEVAKTDDGGLSFKLINGKSETLAWSDLGVKALPKLLPLAVDRASADEWLAAALIALTCDDVPLAEKCFDQARSLGANIDRYLIPLVSAAFARAKDLLDKKRFSEADTALANLEAKYANIPWFATRKKSVDLALTAAKTGIREAEAERLYAEAAELFAHKEFFDLKPLVEKLKTEYASSTTVTDTQRKPTFAELEKAVTKLGMFVTVRQDGKGGFRTIQEAIDSVPPGSLIEIRDQANYSFFRLNKEGTTVRGKRDCWPIVVGAIHGAMPSVSLHGSNATAEHMVFVLEYLSDMHTWVRPVVAHAGSLRLRSAIAAVRQGGSGLGSIYTMEGANCEVEGCLLVGTASFKGRATIRDTVLLRGMIEVEGEAVLENVCAPGFRGKGSCQLRNCTIAGRVDFRGEKGALLDCIVGDVTSDKAGTRIEYCDTYYGKDAFKGLAAPGQDCFYADPLFADPQNFDYRLMPKSPCLRRASDGGDLGCRLTPKMLQMLNLAFELRKKGAIEF